MMAFLQSALELGAPYLLIISLIITIHELGHYLTARAFGVAIDCFSIGFGPPIVSWRGRSGVEWRLSWIPIGGYVKFSGDENIASVPENADLETLRSAIREAEGPGAEMRYLPFKPLWQRALVAVAGPGANFLLATLLFASFFILFGRPVTPNRVERVAADSAAAKAGFQTGDVVTQADSKPIRSFEDLQFYVQYRGGVLIDFSVLRNGQPIHILARPEVRQVESAFGGTQGIGILGLAASSGVLKPVNPVEALGLGVQKTWDVGCTTLYYLSRILTGQVGADQLHSIVGMWHATNSVTTQAVNEAKAVGVSWIIPVADVLVQMAALMSVSIGIMNLLPIPVLDGGHLLAYAYEAVVRRPPAPALQAAGYRAGLALLAGLMLFATWNDLGRQKVFHFLGSLFS
jgi:regulator of sigma E protease